MSERTSAEARGNTGEATAVSELANRGFTTGSASSMTTSRF